MSEVKPITPQEAKSNHAQSIHPDIIKVVNEMLSNFSSETYSIRILQKDIVNKFMEINNDEITRQQIFDRKYLDFEDIYRKAGWKVSYDKPAYCENYEAYYEFSIER